MEVENEFCTSSRVLHTSIFRQVQNVESAGESLAASVPMLSEP